MSDGTHIEWTDASWNPLRAWGNDRERLGWACEKVSDGCKHCYAETINKRLGTGLPYAVGVVAQSGGEHYLDEGALVKPLHWKKPRRIFVCSMTDLFGEWVSDEQIDRIFAVMALTPQHTYQVLTKRPERMRAYLNWTDPSGSVRAEAIGYAAMSIYEEHGGDFSVANQMILGGNCSRTEPLQYWPLPNVWLGTSVEHQEAADLRIGELLACPAAVRFLSCEPLLGPVDITAIDKTHESDPGFSALSCGPDDEGTIDTVIDWVIIGGESGGNARPMDIAWARSLVSQCRAAGTAVFVKQLGAKPESDYLIPTGKSATVTSSGDKWTYHLRSRKGGDMAEWPEDLRVREFPAVGA